MHREFGYLKNTLARVCPIMLPLQNAIADGHTIQYKWSAYCDFIITDTHRMPRNDRCRPQRTARSTKKRVSRSCCSPRLSTKREMPPLSWIFGNEDMLEMVH